MCLNNRMGHVTRNYIKEEAEEFLRMQVGSKAYMGWLNPRNNIYDETFKDCIAGNMESIHLK